MKTSWFLIQRQLLLVLLLALPSVGRAQFTSATMDEAMAIPGFYSISDPASPARQPGFLSAGQAGPLGVNYPDDLGPVLSIDNLVDGQEISNSVYTVTGTAGGNAGIAGVWYQIDGGGWLNATGTTNWSATLTLGAGDHTFQAYAEDVNGNSSPTNTVMFSWVLTATLQVQVAGEGTISPDYSNAVLVVGENYQMTAVANCGGGFAFTNWTGFNIYTLTYLIIFTSGGMSETNVNVSTDIVPMGVLTNDPTLEFTMAAPVNIYTSSSTNAEGTVITYDSLTLTHGYQANFVAIAPSPPVFFSTVLSGTNLVSGVSNGAAGCTYYVLASPNLNLPVDSWTPIATNIYPSGVFYLTNPITPGVPSQFYMLSPDP